MCCVRVRQIICTTHLIQLEIVGATLPTLPGSLGISRKCSRSTFIIDWRKHEVCFSNFHHRGCSIATQLLSSGWTTFHCSSCPKLLSSYWPLWQPSHQLIVHSAYKVVYIPKTAIVSPTSAQANWCLLIRQYSCSQSEWSIRTALLWK